jgi:rhomboid protease GluP
MKEKVGERLNNREDYVFWRLAYYFISNQEYRIIQLFENNKELWLEKVENKKTPIVRLLRHDLDWSNSMQRDIEFTATNGERIRKQIGRSEVKVVNIYISQFPPVDDYEYLLATPFVFPEGNKTEVSSFLITSGEYEKGFQLLSERLESIVTFQVKEDYTEQEVESQKKVALGYAIKKAKIEKEIFTNGKPFFTYILIFIQIAMFFLLEMQGGSTDSSTLIKFGAKFNPYIIDGEWWRFFAPIFLHIGFLHLAMNTMALYFLGTEVERIFGNARFLFIYLFAGGMGFLASFIFSENVSAGASGAIFGCFGALLYFCLIYPKLFFRTMGPSVIAVLVFNLIFGFSISSIDNAGHLGGLAGGFLAAGIMHFPKQKKRILQLAFLTLSTVVVWGSLSYGYTHAVKEQGEGSNLLLAKELIKQENYQQAHELLKEIEEKSSNPSSQVYFDLSYTEIMLNMLTEAKAHLQKAIEIDPDVSEAYFNLALIYYQENDLEQAKKNAEKAVELNPKQEEYANTLREINQLLQ